MAPGTKAALQAQPCPSSDGIWQACRLTVVLCTSTMPACQLCIVHREKAHVHSVASNQMQIRMAPRMLWLVTCSSHPPVSCLQVDMFTGESAVLVSLKELFETVLQGPQAGKLLHGYITTCKLYLTEHDMYSQCNALDKPHAKQGARRRSLGLNITLPSRRQHRQRLSACTGCPARRWILLCNSPELSYLQEYAQQPAAGLGPVAA
jgi:hypothetical protein